MASDYDLAARRSLAYAQEQLASRASAAFVRRPLLDVECPRMADIDILAFSETPMLVVERMDLPFDRAPSIDVIFQPGPLLDEAKAFAKLEPRAFNLRHNFEP